MEHRVGLLRWPLRLSLVALALLVLGLALSVLNNNVSLSRHSRVDFVNGLDRSLAASTGWTIEQFSSSSSDEAIATDLGMEFVLNPPLVHMLVDTSAIAGDPRLQDLSSKIVAAYRKDPPGLIAKLVDPAIAGSPGASAEWLEYQRWIIVRALHLPQVQWRHPRIEQRDGPAGKADRRGSRPGFPGD